MFKGGCIKASFAFLSACLVILALIPGHALGAAAETRYELVSGDTVFGNDLIITGMDQSVFHQQARAASDEERTDIAFPGAVPFSSGVSLALPSISQSVDETVAMSRTGFFTADLPYYPCCNFGAAPVGIGQFGVPGPVTPAGIAGNSLMYPEMINSGILDRNMSTDNRNLNNTMTTLPTSLAPSALGEAAGISAATIGEQARNNTSLGNTTMPRLLSDKRYNFNSGSAAINNTSIVERMWRNSHLSHLMDFAYEGEASSPAWLEPMKPVDGFQRRDQYKVISHSLNMTLPGKYLTRSYWDLMSLTPGVLNPIGGISPGQGAISAPQQAATPPVSTALQTSSGSKSSSSDPLRTFLSSRPA